MDGQPHPLHRSTTVHMDAQYSHRARAGIQTRIRGSSDSAIHMSGIDAFDRSVLERLLRMHGRL